ncbi:hypothetical protein MO973_06715 [Paenibacillus sp. TRM 82003]|nr:hypothetical protein [Paenibacillus sp. TRM 82003]
MQFEWVKSIVTTVFVEQPGWYMLLMAAIFIGCWARFHLLFWKAEKTASYIELNLEQISNMEPEFESRLEAVNDWMEKIKEQHKGNTFFNTCIRPNWKQYYARARQYQVSGSGFRPDVYDFFIEEQFVQSYGKRKLIESISGIFLALGIIGTFVGLAIGVSGLNVESDTEAMKQGVNTLLAGMSVKFFSSITGITLSILWQIFLDKPHFYPWTNSIFNKVRTSMDTAFPTEEEGSLLLQLHKDSEKVYQETKGVLEATKLIHETSKQQLTQMQEFISEVLIEQLVQGVSAGVSTAMQQTIAPHLEETQAIMADMVKQSSSNQLEGVNKMVEKFAESLSEITGDTLKGLGDALQTTIDWQKRVQEDMGNLVESMQQSAKEQYAMVEKTSELTEKIHGYTEHVMDYHTSLERALGELNQATEKNASLQTAFTDLLERMTEERRVFDETFQRRMNILHENIEENVRQTERQIQLQEVFDTNLEKMGDLSKTQIELSSTLQSQSEAAATQYSEFGSLVIKLSAHGEAFDSLQAELYRLITETNSTRNGMEEQMRAMLNRMDTQMNEMDQRSDVLSGYWESQSSSMSQASSELSIAIDRFSSDIHRGLEHTFKQFDDELGEAVKQLAKGVGSIREEIEDLTLVMQTHRSAVDELKRLAQSNQIA